MASFKHSIGKICGHLFLVAFCVLQFPSSAQSQSPERYTKNKNYGSFSKELTEYDLKFIRDDGDDSIRHLKRPFGFTDSGSRKFIAVPGVDINGASIPKQFRAYVGDPWDWDKGFVPAAVVHDVYCTGDHRFEFSCWQVHRMFYDAAIANGTDKYLAKEMYAAILLGGPKWVRYPASRAIVEYVPNADGTLEEKHKIETFFAVVHKLDPEGKDWTEAKFKSEVDKLVQQIEKIEEGNNGNLGNTTINLQPTDE